MGDACSKCFKLLERGLMGFAHVFTLVAAAVRSGKGFYSYFTHTERKGLHRSSAHFQSVKSRPGHRFNAFQRTNICFTSEGLYSYQTPLGMFGHEFSWAVLVTVKSFKLKLTASEEIEAMRPALQVAYIAYMIWLHSARGSHTPQHQQKRDY